MDRLERILSRPLAKPYRTRGLKTGEQIYLNDKGQLDFAPNDIENPKNWSAARRWYITFASVLMVVNATFASSSPTGALESISKELHVSLEASNLVTTLFLLGYVAGPLFWAPISEFFGRRVVFVGTFTTYVILNFLCAWAPNFGALLAGRFLTGTFASAPLSNAPGVLADVWGPIERGNAMALFAVMTFAGPALGPVIGGFLDLKENWRWTFYVLLWLGGISMVFMLTIPETLPAQVLLNKARRLRRMKIPGYENVRAPVEDTDRTLRGIFKVALTRPWIILFDPISFLVAIYIGVVYMLLYMLFTIYPIVFQNKRHWNAGVGELPLIGTVVGAFIGGIIVFLNSARERRKILAGHKGVPEDRLILAMVGGILFPVTMFWFAWTAEYNSVHWAVPTVAGCFLATSILLIFTSYLNYLTDTYLMYAASALAANTIVRSAMGAAAPLFTEQMFDSLGVGGGGSLIGGVACLLAILPFLFFKYGGPIRERSKFAPTGPKGPAAKQETPAEQADDEAERELDDQQGVPDEADERQDDEVKEEKSENGSSSGGDRFLDASGIEKAEGH